MSVVYYDVRLKGKRPLLQHRFNEESEAALGETTKSSSIKKKKTPRDEAQINSYMFEDGTYFIPHMYVFGSLDTVATGFFIKPSRKSIKWLIPAGIEIFPEEIPLLSWEGTPIKHFEVYSKAVTNQRVKAKVMCHRPRFEEWRVDFVMMIDTDMLPVDLVQEVIIDAGKKSGFGAFRPFFGKYFLTHYEENSIYKNMSEEEIAKAA